MKVLIVDDNGEVRKTNYQAEAVIILYEWGYQVVDKQGGNNEVCTDLPKLLHSSDLTSEHAEAIARWVKSNQGGYL